jgi:GT2 family glycosyltransferase
MFSMDPGVGAVGMKLITGDHRLQHVGVSLNEETLPCHSMIGFAADDPGYALQARLVVNTAAVTGACLMTRREVYEELGGLSEDFPINYNDIDYCLKVRQSGRRVVQNNQVEMYHFESLTRDASVGAGDLHKFRLRWEGTLHGDPIYNRNMYPNMSHLPPATSNAELRAVSPAIGAT